MRTLKGRDAIYSYMGRVQAPKLNDGVHPDYFISHSGGVDSTAAYLITRDAIQSSKSGGNYSKKPVMVYLDTRIGVPLNRMYVEQLADTYGEQLWTLRTDESFLEWLRRDGAPGSGAHEEVRRELKDRQVSKLRTLADFPVFILGLAADESPSRAAMSKVEVKRRSDNGNIKHVEVNPVHRLTRKQRVEIILRHPECPVNPLWLIPEAIRDCGCLANGDPSELDKTEEYFPVFAQRLREYEESITHDGLKGTLGWDGLTADEKAAERGGFEQPSIGELPMCSDGCQRRRDPAEVRAFRAKAVGRTVESCVSTLYGTDAPPAVV